MQHPRLHIAHVRVVRRAFQAHALLLNRTLNLRLLVRARWRLHLLHVLRRFARLHAGGHGSGGHRWAEGDVLPAHAGHSARADHGGAAALRPLRPVLLRRVLLRLHRIQLGLNLVDGPALRLPAPLGGGEVKQVGFHPVAKRIPPVLLLFFLAARIRADRLCRLRKRLLHLLLSGRLQLRMRGKALVERAEHGIEHALISAVGVKDVLVVVQVRRLVPVHVGIGEAMVEGADLRVVILLRQLRAVHEREHVLGDGHAVPHVPGHLAAVLCQCIGRIGHASVRLHAAGVHHVLRRRQRHVQHVAVRVHQADGAHALHVVAVLARVRLRRGIDLPAVPVVDVVLALRVKHVLRHAQRLGALRGNRGLGLVVRAGHHDQVSLLRAFDAAVVDVDFVAAGTRLQRLAHRKIGNLVLVFVVRHALDVAVDLVVVGHLEFRLIQSISGFLPQKRVQISLRRLCIGHGHRRLLHFRQYVRLCAMRLFGCVGSGLLGLLRRTLGFLLGAPGLLLGLLLGARRLLLRFSRRLLRFSQLLVEIGARRVDRCHASSF